LLAVANGTPVIAKRLFGSRWAFPLDGYSTFTDSRPLFGQSKTIRGFVLSLAATALAGPVVGLGFETGFVVALAAMAGDLLSSFIKRRLAFAPSSQAIGLDQVPESLFPLLACRVALGLSTTDVATGVGIFFVGELVVSRFSIGFVSASTRTDPRSDYMTRPCSADRDHRGKPGGNN
jgi:CDP-2,3-bis-(O-geranylgeranyl)-sn-glycerol synthase